tara:strand:- start:3650 stop:5455 length:1806 start_codon:yes stop_codon:yes gene_type:complete
MGIPIRLNVGPQGNSTISLDATSLDVSVDRNVSAFPTPNNILNRMAIDTNIPSIEIEIAGILQDDEPISESRATSLDYGEQILMNFAATAPTTNNHWNYMTHLSQATSEHEGGLLEFQIRPGEGFNISASSQTIDVYDRFVGGANEDEAFDNMVGNKLFDKYGRTIGTISSVTFATDLTSDIIYPDGERMEADDQPSGPNVHRVDTITLSSTAIAMDDGEIMYYGVVSPLEDQWIDRCFALYPNYWRTRGNNPNASSTAIIFRFTSAASHLAGGANQPTVTQTAAGNTGNHAVIEIPIGGVMNNSDNGNPANTLALLVQDALEISSGTSLSLESDPIMPELTNSYPSHAFDAQVSGGTVIITQKYRLSTSDSTLGGQPWFYHSPSIYTSSSTSMTNVLSRASSTHQYFRPPADAIRWEVIKLDESNEISEGRQRSAGDKVQDLLGIISNATKGRDLIRGIQIPYDSLITSSGVTGTARNFFLTFGEQNLDDKGSLNNNRDPSQPFIPGIAANDIGGEPTSANESNWLSQFGLGGVANATGSLLSFTGNLIKDSFVSLATAPHGNDGGIRILPEKLHVRYDAGHNYYAFNLKLLASDFVIGV